MSDRMLMRYALLQVERSWCRLPDEERALHKKELRALFAQELPCEVHPYSTVGLRADADLCLWQIASDASGLQAFQAMLNATALGRHARVTHSYLAMTRPSKYLKGHTHAGQESPAAPWPAGAPYLFVYPMDKKREWYRLPFDERRRMMAQHFKIGHRYPGVTIHTGYSFGIDDQEFVVAFEASSPEEFLELVEELRGSEASAYTARDIPIFTCVRAEIGTILDQIDGAAS
jgi:chlorite dismutase